MPLTHRVFLIGGSSHVGKSVLARSLASHLRWTCQSTDRLARHPGRPWQTQPGDVPPHVTDHYLSLSPEELVTDVLRHYRTNVWPLVRDLVTCHATDPTATPLILEGSAILPDLVATLPFTNVFAIWLTAGPDLFKQRIYTTSQYETKTPPGKELVDRFLARTLLFNDQVMTTVKQLGLFSVNVEDTPADELVNACLSLLEKQN